MTAILRFGSVLMILLLTAPMLCNTCLLITHTLPCHGSKHNDVTCSAGQQAIAETKAAATDPIATQFYIPVDPNPAVLSAVRCVITGRVASAQLPANDIYLRTGILLI
jgi:hypothetical protein